MSNRYQATCGAKVKKCHPIKTKSGSSRSFPVLYRPKEKMMKIIIFIIHYFALNLAFKPFIQRQSWARSSSISTRIMKICDVSGPSIGDESSTDKGTESPKMVEVIGPDKEGGRLNEDGVKPARYSFGCEGNSSERPRDC